MFAKQRSNQKQQSPPPPNSLKNVLTCLLVTLLLLFEGHTVQATPITRLRQQQQHQREQQQPYQYQQHNQQQHEQQHHHQHHHQQQQQQQQQPQFQAKNARDCEHKSLAELIKTSPIILKALGAHIFANYNDDDEDLRFPQSTDDALLSSWQSEQNEFMAHKGPSSASSSSSSLPFSSTSSRGLFTIPVALHARDSSKHTIKQKQNQQSPGDTSTDAILPSLNPDVLLITLTPDTIYKGASLLKTATNAAVAAASNTRNGGGSSLGSNNPESIDAANDGDSFYASSSESSAEGQLNATLQPLSCFDGNLLKMLPTDLIIFGKLITMEQPAQPKQQQQQTASDLINGQHGYKGSSSTYSSSKQQQQQHQPTQPTKDIIKISINGLHRWSPQFESFIWTHLGWDDWSDFTVCSVACGKGVQQRFRRCLLDNPMVNLKMNFNEIEEEEQQAQEEELEVEQEVENYDDDNEQVKRSNYNSADENSPPTINDVVDDDDDEYANDFDTDEEKQYDDIDRMIFEDDDDDEIIEQLKAMDDYDNDLDTDALQVDDNVATGGISNESHEVKTLVMNKKHRRPKLSPQTVASNHGSIVVMPQTDVFEMDNNMLHFVTTSPASSASVNSLLRRTQSSQVASTTTEEAEIMRIFEGDFNDVYSERIYNESPFNTQLVEDKKDMFKSRKKGQVRQKHKRHKSAKIVSTMFCEGYNIEQRNCNNFECSDDINDLLKFYRKYPITEETDAVNVDISTANIVAPSLSLSSSSSSSSTLSSASLSAPSAAASSSVAASSSSSSATMADASVIDMLNMAPSTLTSDLMGTSWNSLSEAQNQNLNTITPIPINTGFVKTWHNLLNFTIMLTLRAKNDSYNAASTSSSSTSAAAATATIFSIRNGTHNLYLETYRDGLHLYLERDKTTEMLPIQFNLYDYRWHQVAISIKNGDFISIYIDCSWTNSFVVSKRLFSLPLDADVEVGKGFTGELQQLLILPRLQAQRQCSDKRISINEVKRYIIDTFIGDYGN